MKRVDILIETVVWGDWHLDAYLNVNLPTLLAPGNLPALREMHNLVYVIHTRSADVARIRGARTFQRLEALVPVTLRVIADEEKLRDPIAAHVEIWQDALREARRTRRFPLLMPPDVLWSDGSLAHVGALLGDSKRAIYAPLLRVTSNSFLPAFRERFGSSPDLVAVPGRDLVRMSLEHLHPLMAAYSRASRYFPRHAEMVLWPVAQQGWVRLNSAQLIDGVLPWADQQLIGDSDHLFGVSLAPLGKDVGWHSAAWRITTLDVAQWWLIHDSPANDYVAGARIRWHIGPIDEQAWQAREAGANLFIRRAAIEREALRVLERISSDRTGRALQVTQLINLALLTGRLARSMRGIGRAPAGTVFVFVPEDAALPAVWVGAWLGLAKDRDGRLERLLRDHVAIAPRSVHPDRLRTMPPLELAFLSGARRRLSGAESKPRIGDVTISRIERVSAGIIMCYILGVLSPDELALATGEAGLGAMPDSTPAPAQHV
jgi:hypothetical protein